MARSIGLGVVASPSRPASVRFGTFAALQSPNFRLYFVGQLISTSGTWMQTIAQGYLVFQLTQSELMLGLVACAAGLPMVLVAPFAGVFVERLPRRRVMLVTQTAQMLLAFILAALVLSGTVQIWQIMTLALLLGLTNAFDAPARQTLISDLVGLERLGSGIALNSIIINGSRVFGPTLAGLMLATVGVAWCFVLNGFSFLFVIATLLRLRITPAERAPSALSPLGQLREGLAFAWRHEIVFPILLLAAGGSFLCWGTLSLFPAFADVVLGSPKDGYALISAANGVGAVLGGLIVSGLGARYGRGRVLSIAGPLIGVCIALMSRATTVPAAALLSAGYGFFAVAFFVTCNTTLQLAIPNGFRGRVMALYTLMMIGFNPFGALLLGIIAERAGSPNALLLYGALLTMVCLGVTARHPQVRRA
jgi:MFS family permease